MPFGSKKGDDELNGQKAALFGKSSGKLTKSPPAGSNPYAAPAAANDPYAARGSNPYANQANVNDPYARSASSLTQPPTSSFGSLSLKSDAGSQQGRGPSPQQGSRGPPPSQPGSRGPPPQQGYRGPPQQGYQGAPQQGYQGAPPPGYQGAPQPNRYEKSPVPPGGYGGGGAPPKYQSAGSYGQGGGYGGDAYGNAPPQRQGGYGGMGRSNSQDTMSTDAGRSALFGDAPSRVAQQQAAAQQYGGDSSYANSGGYGASDLHGGYGAPPDRELTAEEQEDQDVSATKGEIRQIKQDTVSSSRRTRQIAEQSEQLGRDTLARLGAQGERIHNTERNLDLASSQNILAEEKARELKTLNRSMFAVHVSNPFTAKKREDAAANLALEKNQREREVREATQAAAYSSQARAQAQQRDLNGNIIRKPGAKNLADRAKYQFEADSEDEEMENELDDNL